MKTLFLIRIRLVNDSPALAQLRRGDWPTYALDLRVDFARDGSQHRMESPPQHALTGRDSIDERRPHLASEDEPKCSKTRALPLLQ